MDKQEKRWDLSPLYKSFTDEKLFADIKKTEDKIDKLLTQITTMIETKDYSLLYTVYEETSEFFDLFEGLYSFASLTYSVNTNDTDALKLIEKAESYMPTLSLIEAKMQAFLKDADVEKILVDYPELSEYAFALRQAKKASNYLLSETEEVLLAELTNTGSKAFSKLQDSIVSTLSGELDGKELPLTILRAKAYDKDASVRKAAYEAELKAYEKKDKESAACLNAIKGEVLTIAKKRGYKNPLEMTLLTSRMDKETLDAMISAIEDFLPSFRLYLKKKATMLGHKNGLPFYDLFAPVGEVDMTYDYNEARDFIIKQFNSFSERLGSYAKTAFDHDWIDPFPREGKVAGAFCANLHSIKESRVMSNFAGSFNDMTTLAHELGHGYHGLCLKDAKAINADYPMPLAETASIFCETIVFNAALKTATEAEKLVILENELMGATQVIVDIYSRYLFETELFKRRNTASLSVDELKEIMLDAQKAAYGDALDPEVLHPYMWMCKPHYYYASSNFYNFPYAFGLLFAKGLYAKYEEDKTSFIPKYDELLLATGCNNIHDVLSIVDVDSHKKEFFVHSLEIIKKNIDEFIK